MNSFTKGAAVALLHILIVASIGGKFLYDRHHYPRVWVKTASLDPDMPVRGRYLTLQLVVDAPWFNPERMYNRTEVRLSVENGRLAASKADSPTGLEIDYRPNWRNDERTLFPSVPFFIPEHAEISLGRPGQELWAEVTVPRKGPPRPIQLAIKNGNDWRPLNLH